MCRTIDLAAFFIAVKLIDCVEILFLNAGFLIKLTLRQNQSHFFLSFFGSAVTVSNCRENFFFVFVKENVVNTPGVNRNRLRNFTDPAALCDTCFHFSSQMFDIPDQRAVIILDIVIEAVDFFENLPKIRRKAQTMVEVGLGYVKLGQSSTTLSGGEAQRVKLATELSRISTGKTIYILDEPTTGLHTDDVRRLLDVLQQLVDAGNTVVVIEHNLDVIKCADHIIDLGPEGGDGGGHIVATGTPEEVAACEGSYTGQYLKRML